MKPTWSTADGSVRLFLGDCRQVLAGLEGVDAGLEGVDAVITDPPYGISLEEHGRRGYDWKIEGDDDQDAGNEVLNLWASGNKLPTCAFASPDRPWPGKWRNRLVWDKGGAVGGGGDIATCWKRTWELILIRDNKPLFGSRDEAVLRYPIGQNDLHHHPTQKPLPLMRHLIYKLTAKGDLVCDPFMGSGSTGVAAIELGRRFVGMEKERRYFDIAVSRIEAELNRAPLFEPAPQIQTSLFAEGA